MANDETKLDALREAVEKRLREAEARLRRAHARVDWQRDVIQQMTEHGRGNLALAEEALVSFLETEYWNEARVNQIKKELKFLNMRQANHPAGPTPV